MNYFDKKETNRIDRLEKKLYSKTIPLGGDNRSEMDKHEYTADADWKDGDLLESNTLASIPAEKPRVGIFFVILALATLFFIGALGYAAYIFVGGEQIISDDDIIVNIVGPVSVGGGDRLSVDVVIQNNSPVQLESANLVINYPEGTKTVDLQEDLRRGRINIGTIAVGTAVKETLDMAFLGENGETKSVDISIEYRLPGSVALLTKSKTFDITLSVAPVQILVNGLERVSSGQDVDLNVEIRSNSERTINTLLVVAEYPFGFVYKDANIKPTYGNNVWLFNTFKPSDVVEIAISGQVQGQDKELRAFRFSAGTPKAENGEEIAVTLTNVRHVITIEKPFVGLDLVVNDSHESSVAVDSGDDIDANILFSNNTNNIVRDIAITLFLEGPALDKSGVDIGGGFYSSFDNRVVFDKTTLKDLAEVEPREQVLITNTLRTLDLSLNNRNLINTEVRVSAIVTGQRVSETGVEEQIQEKDFVTLKVASDLLFKTATTYNQTVGPVGFADSGPIPPRVDQETTYTVTWTLMNSTNDLQNVKVVGIVPSYVTWLSHSSPSDESITYDTNTRRVIWNPGNVSAGVGHSVPARTVSFQLKVRPSISQLQQAPVLVDSINFSAFDTFTNTKIERVGLDTTTAIQGRDTSDLHHFVVQ